MNPTWVVRTGRLVMRPVAFGDLAELQALKADPQGKTYSSALLRMEIEID